MMDSRFAVLVCAVLGVGFCGVRQGHAQNVQRVQPIILTASPGCCQSPAATASQPVLPPCGDCTYLPPDKRDPVGLISTSSRLVPLPTPQEWRGYEARSKAVSGYPETVTTLMPVTTSPSTTLASTTLASTTLLPTTLLPTTLASTNPVYVLRPIVTAPPVPSVPAGYVVGKGLVGQPKLYKPGQPVRNLLRYITL